MKMNIKIIRYFLISISLAASFRSNSQVTSGWETVIINNLCTFELPPTMEIQQGEYKKIQNKLYYELKLGVPQIVAQQRGLNEFSKKGYEKYARIIYFYKDGVEDLFDINTKLTKNIQNEIDEFNNSLKRETETQLESFNSRLIEWIPIKFGVVNGMSSIRIKFIRQLNNNPPVLVETYKFRKNDRLHSLTLSYRISETDFWEKDIKRTLSSFKIF